MLKEFLSKIFKKQEEPKESKLTFSSLENKINELKLKENKKLVQEGKLITNHIKSNIEQTKINLKKFSEKEIDREDKRAYDITEGSRRVLVSHISGALGKLAIPEEIDYSSLSELNNALTDFFSFLAKDAKNFFYASRMLKDYTEEIKESLKNLDDENKSLKQILDSEKLKNLNIISEKISRIKNQENAVEDMKKQKQILEERIKQQEQTKIQLKEKLESLKNSKEYKEYLESKEKIEKLKAEASHAEMRIRTELSPLTKLLRKLENMETDKTKTKNISMLIEDPVNFSLNSYLGLKNILIELKELLIKDKIYLETRDKEKKLGKLHEIENDSLAHLLKEYKKLNNDLEEAQKKEFPVLKEISDLETQISSIKAAPETEKLKITEALEKAVHEIVSEKQKIHELCKTIGENVVLD